MDSPTEPCTCFRMSPGVRKIPEPMTEPMNSSKRSRRRRVRRSVVIRWRVSMSARFPEGNLQEAQNHYQQRDRGQPETRGIEGAFIVDWRDAQKAQRDQNRRPQQPHGGVEISQRDENQRHEPAN